MHLGAWGGVDAATQWPPYAAASSNWVLFSQSRGCARTALRLWVLSRSLYNNVLLKRFVVGVYHPFIALPPPASLPYCNTIVRLLRNIPPPTDPPLLCPTPYNIGDGNVVQRPICRTPHTY